MKTDAILDGKNDTEIPEAEIAAPKSHEEFIEETVAKCRYLCQKKDVYFVVVDMMFNTVIVTDIADIL